MTARFERRSNNSPRSSRVNVSGRKKQENNRSFSRPKRRDEQFDQPGSYRPRSDGRSDSQYKRETSKNEGYRRGRKGQERRFLQENESEFSASRSFSRKFNNQRSSGRNSRLKTREDSALNASRSSHTFQTSDPSERNESLTSFYSTDSSGRTASSDILWGRHSTQSALESGRPVHRIWCTSELRSSQRFLQLIRDAKSSGVLVEEVTWARLGQLTHGGVHQGIAIQIAAAETLDLPTLIEGCNKLDESPLLLALDGLTDPQNLGAIVRSAEAFGAHGLVLPQRRSAGLTGSVAKVAAGALEHLPVARVVNLNRSLEALKKSGYRVIGLAEEGDTTLPEADLEGPLVVVIGSEGKGISLVTRRHCDQLVRIPLRGITPSLNASAASAVFLYEVARKGWMKGLSGQDPSPRMTRAKYASASLGTNDPAAFKDKNLKAIGSNGKVENPIDFDSSFDDLKNSPLINTELEVDSRPFDQSVSL